MNEYKIVFRPKCERKIEQLEKNPTINRTLEAIYISIRANPWAFNIAPPIAAIRYAKGVYELEDGAKATVVLLFTIIEDDQVVDVLDAYILDKSGKQEDV